MRVPSRQEFLKDPVGIDAKRELQRMVSSLSYNTSGSCDPRVGKGLVFVERHLGYLIKHPYVSPQSYLTNLRVMTKVNR